MENAGSVENVESVENANSVKNAGSVENAVNISSCSPTSAVVNENYFTECKNFSAIYA